jgi:hypothetical protein
MKGLLDLIRKPNVVVIDSLPKARLMNKLLLIKITLLTIIGALLLHMAGWNYWMLGIGVAFVAVWTIRGLRRDVRHQNAVFAHQR